MAAIRGFKQTTLLCRACFPLNGFKKTIAVLNGSKTLTKVINASANTQSSAATMLGCYPRASSFRGVSNGHERRKQPLNSFNTLRRFAQSGGYEKAKKLWSASLEYTVVLSVLAWISSSTIKWFLDKKQAMKDVQLELINHQIERLYGPLYGNRLVEEKTYRAVMGEHGGLKKYLNQARETQDPEMIRRWRSFVTNVLYPLDKEAEVLISKNGHLISDCEFPEAFESFLNHLAQLQFVMEKWKSDDKTTKEYTEEDYLEENNASGNRGCKDMFKHIELKYKELKKAQQKLKVEIHLEDNEEHLISHALEKIGNVQ